MTPDPTFDRQRALQRLAATEFDVLVVGAGITGVGVALDATARGLSVALVERDDFSSGTSSKSSKLVHGGLRYLQQGDVNLVYQALHERHRLRRNAPHLVKVLPFMIPVLTKDGVVSRKIARALGSAMWMYDLTGGWRIGRFHRRLRKAAALSHLPTMPAARLASAYLYYDAAVDDSRLVVTVARTAARRGAVVANQCAVVGLLDGTDGSIAGAVVEADGRRFPVRARVVVNAAGVWADSIRSFDEGVDPDSIRPAKGVHVTIPWEKVRNDIAVVIPVPKDRRSLFVIPWGPRQDGTFAHTYVGTTDTDYTGPLDAPQCTKDDIDYVLAALNHSITTGVTADDITGVWAGLRPLVKASDVSGRTADLSRHHKVNVSDRGLISVTGGKLTTYREMAEDTVDAVVARLGRKAPCRTRRLPLLGAEGYRGETPGTPAAHLADRYGSLASEITALVADRPDLGAPLVPGLPYLRAEAVYAVHHEMATTVDDVLTRRTRARLLDRPATMAAAHDVAALLAAELGWDAERTAAEVAHFLALCDDEVRAGHTSETTDASRRAVTTDHGDDRRPTPPIELAPAPSDGTTALLGPAPAIPPAVIETLRSICEVVTDDEARREASRDWWPLALHWALQGRVPAVAGLVARPRSTDQVAAVLRTCSAAGVAVTPAGGRSSVVGGAVPLAGGVLLDLTALCGVIEIDPISGLVGVRAGTFGPDLEDAIRPHGLTVGHFPQSHDLATVGGWIGHRGAGQYSTRYGKVEHMVAALEVVLPDGRIVRTGAGPAGAQGPDLSHLFLGAEGTLGVVTTAWLRAWPLPACERRAAYAVATFDDGLEACRRILRRGATPAVLRLYDAAESARGQGADGTYCVLLVVDEGDEVVVEASMSVVDAEALARPDARRLDVDLVEQWMHHRNDTNALQVLTRKGFVVDTMEIAGPWSALPDLVRATETAILAVPHARAATCHLSHSYPDGACLYFTFAATPPPEEVEATYTALWDAGQRAVLAHGGNLSHHHGVGASRGRFVSEALGASLEVVQAVKDALDPSGIMNPGKLGLRSSLGPLHLTTVEIP